MKLSNLALSLGLITALAVAGCNRPVDVNAPGIRGIGYVRVDDVLKRHPLYGQLAQIDSAIEVLGLKSLGPSVPRTGAALSREAKALNAQLKAAQDRANGILRQKQNDYSQRESAAMRAAMAAAGQGSGGAQSAAAMQSISASQAQAATAAANRDFGRYQQAVVSQDNAAISQINGQLALRADRQYRLKATQLQERESELSLNLAQKDSSERLQVRTKLSNLALDDATRARYQAELRALDGRESRALAAQRAIDARELAEFRRNLQAQTSASVRAQAAKIHSETTAKIQSRRNEVSGQIASQVRGLAPAPVPANVSPDVRSKLQQIDKQFKAQFAADAAKTVAQYQSTKADLDARYAALTGADAGSAGATAKGMNDLRRQRQDLYSKMVEQIKRESDKIAAERGLRVVLTNVQAAAGGVDLTDDVAKDIESLHE
ncbi:MAG: OmpH family outer membrane protein [Candidatus Eremiobacteraeota bacterium]|nr:OmpH family outer membrane protein [Candidatus Eremiobacteraeota bacterium]